MLRLAAGASMVKHHRARDVPRLIPPEVVLDQAKSHINAGRHSRRGPYLTVGDIYSVHFDDRLGEPLSHEGSMKPMCGSTSPIQQAGFSENKGPDANRSDSSRASRHFAEERQKLRLRRPC